MAIDNRNPAASTTHVRTDTPQRAQPPQSPLEYRPPTLHAANPRDHLPMLGTLPASTTAASAVTTTQAPQLQAVPNSGPPPAMVTARSSSTCLLPTNQTWPPPTPPPA